MMHLVSKSLTYQWTLQIISSRPPYLWACLKVRFYFNHFHFVILTRFFQTLGFDMDGLPIVVKWSLLASHWSHYWSLQRPYKRMTWLPTVHIGHLLSLLVHMTDVMNVKWIISMSLGCWKCKQLVFLGWNWCSCWILSVEMTFFGEYFNFYLSFILCNVATLGSRRNFLF